jgi:hypothetical protein
LKDYEIRRELFSKSTDDTAVRRQNKSKRVTMCVALLVGYT